MRFSTSRDRSPFIDKLRNGQLTVGTWINSIRDPSLVKLIGFAGFDYVLIDIEHSGMTNSDLMTMCMLARECGVTPIIRPFEPNDLKFNSRLIDMGAMGIIIPHVDSAEQAKAVAGSLRFFNGGTRGFSEGALYAGPGNSGEPYMRKCDDQVICIAQFESRAAVEQADAIMAVDGIDIAIVGRGDLAHDIGLPGKASGDEVTALVDRVIAAARRNNKVAGILVATPEEGRTWADKGMRFLTYGNEIKFLMATYAKGLEIIRGGK